MGTINTMYQVYYDEHGKGNLHEYSFENSNCKEPLAFNNYKFAPFYSQANFIISQFNLNEFRVKDVEKIKYNGIYTISLGNHPNRWSGLNKTFKFPDKHILYYLPHIVYEAVRQHRMIIVIDNQAEGMLMHTADCDAYKAMHKAMKDLNLPSYSVLLITGNEKFYIDYCNWCMLNNIRPKFAHVDFFTHCYYFENNRTPTYTCIETALLNQNSKDFNSLNRTVRNHRIAHLYYCIKNNYHNNNLISGHYNEHNEKDYENSKFFFIHEDSDNYVNTLKQNLPLQIDGNWNKDNPDLSSHSLFNLDTFKNSLLSFVTETAFHDPGLFLTEKIFKPIAAGHPFIVLGQRGMLRSLREKGFRTDFFGIDQTYDDIENPYERFHAVHKSLKAYIDTPRNDKITNTLKSLEMIKHNQELFRKTDFINNSYKKLYTTVDKIFRKEYNPYEKS